MKSHNVRTHKSSENLPRADQLAWKIAEVASDPVAVEPAVIEMIGNRIIDNAAVAAASVARRPVASARAQAAAHPFKPGATVFGLPQSQRISPEWAAWANGVAVRELDFHDTFLAADYSHPGDNIPPILAVAQHCGLDGAALVRGLATGYEIQVDLVKGICLHEHKIDHIAHLGPSVAAGIGTLLRPADRNDLSGRAAGTACHDHDPSVAQGRDFQLEGIRSSLCGKMAIEAVDRVMRGEGAPSPAWEGEDGFIAWLLVRSEGGIHRPAAREGRAQAGYTRYLHQGALGRISKPGSDRSRAPNGTEDRRSRQRIESIVIHTSHHTHYVIGTGANDPQKMDPKASRETLDHSIMYIFAVALEDGGWHHQKSYAPERARAPGTVALWHKISTVEDIQLDRALSQP